MHLSVTLLGLLYRGKKCSMVRIIIEDQEHLTQGALCMHVVFLLGDFRDRSEAVWRTAGERLQTSLARLSVENRESKCMV